MKELLKEFLSYLRLNRNASAHTVRAYESDITQYLKTAAMGGGMGAGFGATTQWLSNRTMAKYMSETSMTRGQTLALEHPAAVRRSGEMCRQAEVGMCGSDCRIEKRQQPGACAGLLAPAVHGPPFMLNFMQCLLPFG